MSANDKESCLIYLYLQGNFSVEIRPKLSVSELCAAVSCDIHHALDTACEFDSELVELFTESVFSGTLEQEDKDTFKDVMLRQAHHIKLLAN